MTTRSEQDAQMELAAMKSRLRTMRYWFCEPRNNTNPRYHAFSAAVSAIDFVINDLEKDKK